jgi:glycosyltransferase involved in cell wall biosynthesis
MPSETLKIVYVTPALYMAGGVERVLTLKANYFAEQYGYDITIILTEGKGKPLFYPLSEKVKVVNLDINFEQLWGCPFLKKGLLYLKKQRQFKKRLTHELMRLHADLTISLLRREINFICDIPDGSKKIGEIHINRSHYRNFESNEANWLKNLFARYWMSSLVGHLQKLARFVVLTEKDRESWPELTRVEVIPDPLSFVPKTISRLTEKRVIAVARYSYEKGIDLLLQAWSQIERQHPDWRLDVYGDGDATPYQQQREALGIDANRCGLHGRTDQVEDAYCHSSLFVLSSRFEGFGMVILEAMACGLPVVSFACPYGPQSIIEHGVNGLLAENGNVGELAKALSRMMADADLRKTVSQAALQHVERYRIERIAGRWKNLFNEVVAHQ